MSGNTDNSNELRQQRINILPFLAILAFAVVIGILAIFLVRGPTEGELIPLLPTRTPLALFDIEPELVTFDELQENPAEYQDKVVRVSGDFERLPLPPCLPHSGPGARWSLVADSLRLDVVGFNELLHIVEEPAIFTIDGIFRLYRAPLGCGKEPLVDAAWYLEALNVVEPNPLIVSRSTGLVAASGVVINSLGSATPLAVITATPGGIVTPSPSPTGDQLATTIPTPTRTANPNEMTPTPTSTDELIPTATPIGTPAATATEGTTTPTPIGQTPTMTATPSVTPSIAPTDPSVPLPTATTGDGGGYLPPPTFDPYP